MESKPYDLHMPHFAAVLTGDLIGSTDAHRAQVERSMAVLAQAAAFLDKKPDSQCTRFTWDQGDRWQIHLRTPGRFLDVVVFLNAMLRSEPDTLRIRIAIGLGMVDSLGDTGLGRAHGTAFTESGRGLADLIVAGQTLTLAGPRTDDIQRSTLAFIDDRMSGWSREQAEVVKLKMAYGDPSQGDIAAKLGISRQAVGSRLQASGYALIRRAGNAFHDHFDKRESTND